MHPSVTADSYRFCHGKHPSAEVMTCQYAACWPNYLLIKAYYVSSYSKHYHIQATNYEQAVVKKMEKKNIQVKYLHISIPGIFKADKAEMLHLLTENTYNIIHAKTLNRLQ